MSNRGKKKCATCGCFDIPEYKIQDDKKTKYYCGTLCFRTTIENDCIGKKTCSVCGKNLGFCEGSDIYEAQWLGGDTEYFCSPECYAFELGMLLPDTFQYQRIAKLNELQKAKKNEQDKENES